SEVTAPKAEPSGTQSPAGRSNPTDVATLTTTSAHSSTRTVLLIGGGLLTAASLGTWIGFASKASSASSDADRLRSESPQGTCAQTPDSATCASLRDALDRRSSATNVARVGMAGTFMFGVGVIGTLLFWPKSSGGSSVSLAIAPEGSRLLWKGEF